MLARSRLSYYTAHSAIKRFREQHPLMKRLNCHNLRHSYVVNSLDDGAEIWEIQKQVGHKKIGTTMDIYAQYDSKKIKRHSPYRF